MQYNISHHIERVRKGRMRIISMGQVTGLAINKDVGVDLWLDVNEDGHVLLENKTFDGIVDFGLDASSQVKEDYQWCETG